MAPFRLVSRQARPAGLFLIVLLIVLGSSFWEKHLLHNMNTAAASLYKDRLLPATGLFQLNDLMYGKQQLLASYLEQPSAEQQHYVQVQISGRNVEIDSILSRYEATYLVAEETKVFGTLKARLQHYNALEGHLLAAGPTDAAQARALARQFGRIHADLSRLNRIQQQVGHELSKSSRDLEIDADLISNLKIGLLVAFTLIIQQALLWQRLPLLPKNTKNFRLN